MLIIVLSARACALRRMPLDEQAADLRQRSGRLRVAPVALLARPNGVLVELDVFLLYGSKNHRSQPAVAHRQGPRPGSGGLPVPAFEGVAVLRMTQARAQ